MTDRLRKRLDVVAENARGVPEIDALYLFGSYAEGSANALSDIDLGVLLDAGVSPDRYFDLKRRYLAEFADILKTDRVDVVVLNDAPAHLALEVVSPRNILYERNPAHRVAFEIQTVNKFFDFRPFLEVRRAYVKQQLARGDFFG